jgi:hypothetical protein
MSRLNPMCFAVITPQPWNPKYMYADREEEGILERFDFHPRIYQRCIGVWQGVAMDSLKFYPGPTPYANAEMYRLGLFLLVAISKQFKLG